MVSPKPDKAKIAPKPTAIDSQAKIFSTMIHLRLQSFCQYLHISFVIALMSSKYDMVSDKEGCQHDSDNDDKEDELRRIFIQGGGISDVG